MRKDVDLMSDTGGAFKHKDLIKPPRKDRKKHTLSENDPDAKDIKKDPDMKLSNVNKQSNQLVDYDRHNNDKYKFIRIYALYKSSFYNKEKLLDYCEIYDNELIGLDEIKEIASIIERDYPEYFKNIDNYICVKENNKNFWIAKDKNISYFYLIRIN